MRILYVALKYDYGKPEQGYSFEHYNFFDALMHMGHDILYFDFMALLQRHDRHWMNRRLLEVARSEKPDLMFTVLFTNELQKQVIREISENTDTTTLNWFCDDHWRFDIYSRHWAPCFNWVVTTAQSALPKYRKLGYQNVIKSQWACNHYMYRNMELPPAYDVTFVGQPHGNRRAVIQALGTAGIDVRAWGSGWESGRLSQEEMIRVFNQSRINLNLTDASVSTSSLTARTKHRASMWTNSFLNTVPFGLRLKLMGKRWLSRLPETRPHAAIQLGQDAGRKKYADQIKGRNFEIPGCGGFILTGHAEELESYYDIGKEIVCFEDLNDLMEKARYYLSHDDERTAIAQAGYLRTMREHTYAHRLTEIFERLRLPCEPLAAVLGGNLRPGQTEEVR